MAPLCYVLYWRLNKCPCHVLICVRILWHLPSYYNTHQCVICTILLSKRFSCRLNSSVLKLFIPTDNWRIKNSILLPGFWSALCHTVYLHLLFHLLVVEWCSIIYLGNIEQWLGYCWLSKMAAIKSMIRLGFQACLNSSRTLMSKMWLFCSRNLNSTGNMNSIKWSDWATWS